MVLITLDGRRWNIKYRQNLEKMTVLNGTSTFRYPDFVGTKIKHNSTSSDRYSFNFAIHSSEFVAFKESMKLTEPSEADAIEDDVYGKLTHIIVEHPRWGAIKGTVDGEIQYDTSSEADIPASCVFQIHAPDEPIEQADLEETNDEALEEIDEETEWDEEIGEVERGALLEFLDKLNAIYANIKNSKVIAAFNDLKKQLNNAILNSKKIMNAVKKILALPGEILDSISDFKRQFDLLKQQAEAIKNIPVTTFNLAKFNFYALSYNMGITSKTTFVSPEARAAAAGIKTVPLV
jgi:hypothetical protein